MNFFEMGLLGPFNAEEWDEIQRVFFTRQDGSIDYGKVVKLSEVREKLKQGNQNGEEEKEDSSSEV